ncbi:MAG: hypothetical protein M3Z75_15475 [Actinomycetota bacterium]|nr:hypothetical protein [Actinomycetota bacterium]
MPAVPGCPDDERVGVELLGGRGKFPGRAAPAGADVHFHVGLPGHLVQFGEQPALQRLGVPRNPDDLPGERLAVDPRRAHVHHEQRSAQAPGHPRRVSQGVAARRRAVVAGDDRMVEPERGGRRLGGSACPGNDGYGGGRLGGLARRPGGWLSRPLRLAPSRLTGCWA